MTRAPLRIVIAGGPRTGKTTLAATLGLPVLHTDDLIPLGWSAAGAVAAEWLDRPGPWVLEGVTAPRALRRWLARHPTGAPCDRIVFLAEPAIPRTPGQEAMAKGCAKIYGEIEDELRARGVKVISASSLRRRRAARRRRASSSSTSRRRRASPSRDRDRS